MSRQQPMIRERRTHMADEITVLFNLFPELAKKLHDTVGELVRKGAFDVQALASGLAPVATGHLKSSIYVVPGGGKGSSTYGQNVEGDGVLLPEVEAPESDQQAIVAVAANYGVYVEFGTAHAGAQPYLTPAAEAVRGPFTMAMSHLEEALVTGAGGSGAGSGGG
jgi:hypothetical protein